MRKTRILLVLFVLLGTGLFAQSGNNSTSLFGNEPLLQQNTTLKAQAAQVNAAFDQLKASAASSRAAGASAAANLNTACNSYIAELKKLSSGTSDKPTIDAVTREIDRVKKVQSDFCPSEK